MERDPLLKQASIKSDCPEALTRMIEDRDVFAIRNFIDSNNDTHFKVFNSNTSKVPLIFFSGCCGHLDNSQ